jgi:TetR/AcrR family transcriptional regulator
MALTTQQRILNAARKVFIELGKGGARVDAIARRAKVNKALIYYYYSSKDQLYYHVLKHTFSTILARISGALSQEQSPEERILKMVDAYHTFLMQHRSLPVLILREMADGAPVLKKVASEILSADFQDLTLSFDETIREGDHIGLWEDVDPRQTLVSLLGMLIFPFAAAPLIESALGINPESEFWQERPQAVLDIFFHGIEKRETT